MLDGLLHAVEFGEGGIKPQDFVREDAAQARMVAGVDQLGLANGLQHALGGTRISTGIGLAQIQILVQAHVLLAGGLVSCLVTLENRHTAPHWDFGLLEV